VTLTVQIETLVSLMGLGVFFGIGLDGYRVLRNRLSPPRWLVYTCDLLIWWAGAILAFVVLLWVNRGQIRLSFFLVIFLGLMLYYGLASRFVQKCWRAFYRLIHGAARGLAGVIQFLFIRPVLLVYRILFSAVRWMGLGGAGLGLFFWRAGKGILLFIANLFKKRE
jgi:spore cortex biosynthesis protein YabQ